MRLFAHVLISSLRIGLHMDNNLKTESDLKAEYDDLLMRSRILQKYSLASIAGLIISLLALKYAPNGNPILLIIMALVFAISAGLKLYFGFRWHKQARRLIGQG